MIAGIGLMLNVPLWARGTRPMYLRNAWYVAGWSNEFTAHPVARVFLDGHGLPGQGGLLQVEIAGLEQPLPARGDHLGIRPARH